MHTNTHNGKETLLKGIKVLVDGKKYCVSTTMPMESTVWHWAQHKTWKKKLFRSSYNLKISLK